MRWHEIFETTSAGNVATLVGNGGKDIGGIGAGFDPDGHWGVYQGAKKKSKKTSSDGVIRRPK